MNPSLTETDLGGIRERLQANAIALVKSTIEGYKPVVHCLGKKPLTINTVGEIAVSLEKITLLHGELLIQLGSITSLLSALATLEVKKLSSEEQPPTRN